MRAATLELILSDDQENDKDNQEISKKNVSPLIEWERYIYFVLTDLF